MTLNVLKLALVSILVLALETLVLVLAGPGNFNEITGAKIFLTGSRCAQASTLIAEGRCTDNAEFTTASLPTIYRNPDAESHLLLRMRFSFSRDIIPDGLAAIYLPKISDAVHVSINGQTIVDMGDFNAPPIRHWNAPVFATVPDSILRDSNELEITLSAYKPDGTMLHPFFVGPEQALKSSYQFRYLATRGVAYLAMAFMCLSTMLFTFLFLSSRLQPAYGYLTLASISAFVFVSHYAISAMPFDYILWTITWNAALNILLLSLFIFTNRYLGQPPDLFERALSMAPLVVLGALVVLPKDHLLYAGGVLHVSTMIIGVATTTNLLLHRYRLQTSSFIILYVLFSISLAFGIRDWIIVYTDPTSSNMLTSQFGIMLMMASYGWLAASDLIRSVNELDKLNRGMQITIEEKTRELERSFEKLAAIENRRTLEHERNRIMLDLHDGVGGQLVNTLAYMQTDETSDPTVRTSIEGVLRDLGLMIDSLEAQDSLTTSLGMLRSRLEPLLERTGMTFRWQVMDEPETHGSGPSHSLNVLRIAQEAITNAVKHANATEISVETDANSITIRDNGSGFEEPDERRRSGENSGIGIAGMKKRADAIGAEFLIKGTTSGTSVVLTWKENSDHRSG